MQKLPDDVWLTKKFKEIKYLRGKFLRYLKLNIDVTSVNEYESIDRALVIWTWLVRVVVNRSLKFQESQNFPLYYSHLNL